jgi:hypothetical protein
MPFGQADALLAASDGAGAALSAALALVTGSAALGADWAGCAR